MSARIENMAINESLIERRAQAPLVKEQVTQTVVEKGTGMESHRLREMPLTAGDDYCAGLGHALKIAHRQGVSGKGLVFNV